MDRLWLFLRARLNKRLLSVIRGCVPRLRALDLRLLSAFAPGVATGVTSIAGNILRIEPQAEKHTNP